MCELLKEKIQILWYYEEKFVTCKQSIVCIMQYWIWNQDIEINLEESSPKNVKKLTF